MVVERQTNVQGPLAGSSQPEPHLAPPQTPAGLRRHDDLGLTKNLSKIGASSTGLTLPRIAVLYGGSSAEHEISIITALQALEAIDPTQYDAFPVYVAPTGKWYTGDPLYHRPTYLQDLSRVAGVQEVCLLPDPSIGGFVTHDGTLPADACFLAFHGQQGEDGCVQGLLELAGLPYTGGSVHSSSLVMHKAHTKEIVASAGIPVVPYALVRRPKKEGLAAIREQILSVSGLDYPLFVKPNHLGSSIGISKATDEASLNAALAHVFRYDDSALVELCLTDLFEINIAVLDGDPPLVSPVEIPVATGDALSFNDKYCGEGSKTVGGSLDGMAGLTRVIDPVDLPQPIKDQARDYALQAFELLECSGCARIDFMLDRKTETLYFNELNPIPGSFAFYLWEKAEPRLLLTEVIDQMITRAITRHRGRLALQKDLAFRVLS